MTPTATPRLQHPPDRLHSDLPSIHHRSKAMRVNLRCLILACDGSNFRAIDLPNRAQTIAIKRLTQLPARQALSCLTRRVAPALARLRTNRRAASSTDTITIAIPRGPSCFPPIDVAVAQAPRPAQQARRREAFAQGRPPGNSSRNFASPQTPWAADFLTSSDAPHLTTPLTPDQPMDRSTLCRRQLVTMLSNSSLSASALGQYGR